MGKKGILLVLVLLFYGFKAQQVERLTEGEVEYHFFSDLGKNFLTLKIK